MINVLNKILTKIGGVFKFDAKYVLGGLTWLGVSQIFTSVTAFATTIIIARYLSQESLGAYKYLFSLIGLVGTFSLTGLITSVANAASKNYDGTLEQAFKLNIKFSLISFLIYNTIGIYYFIRGNETFTFTLFIISILQPIIDSSLLYNPFLNGKMRFKEKTVTAGVTSISNILCLGVSSYLSDNVFLIISSSLFCSFFVNLVIYKTIKAKFCINNKTTNDTLEYGKYWSFLNFFGQISLQMDKFLLFNYIGPAQLAIYSIATGPVQQLRSIGKLIGAIVLPRYANQEFSTIKNKIFHKGFLIFIMCILIVILYFICAPFLYATFFPNYIDSIKYSRVFSLVLLVIPGVLIKQAFIGHMKKRELNIIHVFIPVFKILLLVILIPKYGIMGAILSIIAAEYLNLLLNFYLFKKTI